MIVPITYVTGIQRRKAYFLKTNVMYFKSYVLSFEKECQRSLNHEKETSDQFGTACYIYHFRYFLLKREITSEVASFRGSLNLEGSLLSRFANTCEILSLLSEGRYFGNFTVLF